MHAAKTPLPSKEIVGSGTVVWPYLLTMQAGIQQFYKTPYTGGVPLLWLLTEPCQNCLLDFSVRLESLSLECLHQWSKDMEVTDRVTDPGCKGGVQIPPTPSAQTVT